MYFSLLTWPFWNPPLWSIWEDMSSLLWKQKTKRSSCMVRWTFYNRTEENWCFYISACAETIWWWWRIILLSLSHENNNEGQSHANNTLRIVWKWKYTGLQWSRKIITVENAIKIIATDLPCNFTNPSLKMIIYLFLKKSDIFLILKIHF